MEIRDCAGGIVVNSRREVALVKNGPDFWGFPKGRVDDGEDLLTAAKREIREESGLRTLTLVKELPIYERYRGTADGGDDTRELKRIHMFLFTTNEEELMPEDDGNPEARWVPIDEVTTLLTHPKDREFFDSMKAELGK